MPNVEARIKVKGNQYEISVELDEALMVKNGKGDVTKALNSNAVYYDLKKGNLASEKDLKDAFGTVDLYKIAEKIMTDGEIQKTQEYRDEEREKRIKRVINLILRNAVDQHGRSYTEDRIRKAISEIHFNFDNRPPEQQMSGLIHELKKIIPIKIETKRLKLKIPARFTGQAYSLIKDYKEREEWLPNGDLEVIINIPSGMQIDFYEKLNAVTHGAAVSEEIQE